MTDRIVVSEPLPMPTGPPPCGPWMVVAILGAVGVTGLIAIVALRNGDDGRDTTARTPSSCRRSSKYEPAPDR